MENQLFRSVYWVSENYRAAPKGISRKSFMSKLSIAFGEVDERLFWLEAIKELNLITPKKLSL